MIEKQKLQRINQEKLILLHELEKKYIQEIDTLKENCSSNLDFSKTPPLLLASGVVTFATSYAVTQSIIESATLATAEMAVVSGSLYGISSFFRPDQKYRARLVNRREQLKLCQEEMNIRSQVDNYLSYGIILASKGYYQECLTKACVQQDYDLHVILEQMIVEIIQDELLEIQDPDLYNNRKRERDEMLEEIIAPEKLYTLLPERIDNSFQKVLQ